MPQLRRPLTLLALAACAWTASLAAPLAPQVSRYVYQLQPTSDGACNQYLGQIALADADLAIIDFACGVDPTPFTRSQIEALRTKPDGGRRYVLAYLNVGQAESYRWYWQPSWEPEVDVFPGYRPGNPAWLGPADPVWPENYLVRYWDPAWQGILIDGPPWGPNGAKLPSYMDRILAAGFDGVFLDQVEIYEHWEGDKADAREQAVKLVERIRDYGRARFLAPQAERDRHPGWIVVGQNAASLIADPTLGARYRAAVSGVSLEEVYYQAHDVTRPAAETATLEASLDLAKQAGLLVLTTDYALDPGHQADAIRRARARGYVPYVTHNELDRFTPQPAVTGPVPTPTPTPAPTPTASATPTPTPTATATPTVSATPTPTPTFDGDPESESEDRPSDDDEDEDPDPAGGDPTVDDDEGRGTGELRRVVTGAAIGAVLGIALGPVGGLAGGLAGALVGELWHTHKEDEDEGPGAPVLAGPRLAPAAAASVGGAPPAEAGGPAAAPADAAREFAEAEKALRAAVVAGTPEEKSAAWVRYQAAWAAYSGAVGAGTPR